MATIQKPPFTLDTRIQVSPPDWPNCQLQVQPGDLSVFFEQDLSPWKNPFQSAHPCEASGGFVYFGNDIRRSDLEVLLYVMGIAESDDYAVFTAESTNPKEDCYLAQMRLVSKFGLHCGFNARNSQTEKGFPEQELSISEALWAFIRCECDRWGTRFDEDCKYGLRPLFLKNYNDTRVELSFGIAMESSRYRIFRVWSRGWLVGK